MMGQCLLSGWSEHDFWFSTYRAVFNLIRAQNEAEERRYKDAWERTRMLCDFVIAPHKRKGATGRAFELPWDHEPEQDVKVLTEAEKQAIFEKMDRRVKKKFQNA